ncbi:hypothetical protein NBO_73g0008 [Nosema bombycis CQ1]|uniref:Protein FAM72 n=1 Tax=Nosema bombycis (strain CQ1 / CVCC 102059) TaxID=578461 RepID=R0KT94_NOSB1|nr:hypothetical protein NBO_73g0008 [Nosema bombycis CQ1]|eukprot:EOB13442.1 hypothetical protein NBO_73g0008 [Nosema bombycis CQ1]
MRGYKFVYLLKCRVCNSILSRKAMKSVLLSNPKIKLYSSNDISKVNTCGLNYMTRSCDCVISNIKCEGCNCLIGYTILIPCLLCLKDKNNGHLWMFDMFAVTPTIQITGLNVLKWVTDNTVNEETELKMR